MTTTLLKELFERDLTKVIDEVTLYKNETDIWAVPPGISNSAGTLCLHLAGNLKHFIGAVLGKTGYVRQRDIEFSDRNVPKQDLLKGLNEALNILQEVFPKLNDEGLAKEFPIEFMGKRSTLSALLLLCSHLSYHLGQINYHRRLISK